MTGKQDEDQDQLNFGNTNPNCISARSRPTVFWQDQDQLYYGKIDTNYSSARPRLIIQEQFKTKIICDWLR